MWYLNFCLIHFKLSKINNLVCLPGCPMIIYSISLVLVLTLFILRYLRPPSGFLERIQQDWFYIGLPDNKGRIFLSLGEANYLMCEQEKLSHLEIHYPACRCHFCGAAKVKSASRLKIHNIEGTSQI